MGILLAFAPFLAFALVDRFVDPVMGLWAGTLAAAVLIVRDVVTPGRAPKILEIGTLILFGGLAIYAQFAAPGWSVIGVRLRVDGGLLLIVLASMAVGRPFTLQYARTQVSPDLWNAPAFIRTNYVITAAWAVAFAVMVLAELAILYVPNLPQRAGVIAIFAALIGAVKFTGWYPEHSKGTQAT